MGSLTASIDLKRYGRLLAKAVPRVIATEEENERALAIVESLMEKGERNMTPEEDALPRDSTTRPACRSRDNGKQCGAC